MQEAFHLLALQIRRELLRRSSVDPKVALGDIGRHNN
jgi:hypothetical protein